MLSNKSSESKAVTAGIGYTIGNYLLKGLNFFTIPLFSRLLSTSDYGIVNTFNAYEAIVYVLIGLAIHSSYKNARYKYKRIDEGAETGKDYNTYLSATMVLLLFSLVCWGLGINILSPLLSNWVEFNRAGLNILIIYAFSNAVIVCFNTYVGIDYKYKSFLTVATISAVANIALSILLIKFVFKEQAYWGRILGTAIPSCLIAIYVVSSFFKQSKPKNIKYFLKWGIHYSLPIVPHGLSQIVLGQFDRIMITKMINSAVSGVYSFGYNIFSIVQVTANSLDSVWTPWFYEKYNQKEYQIIRKYGSLYSLLILIFSVVVMLISPELVKILGTKKYWESVYCVPPLIAGGYYAFLYTLPASIEYFFEKTKYTMIGTMSAACINIVLNYIFISRYGYVAAAYTTLATYFLYFLFHYFLSKRIAGRFIYSNKVMALCCIVIFVANVFTCYLIPYILIRWFFAIVIACVTLIIEEKKYGFVISIIRKRIKR